MDKDTQKISLAKHVCCFVMNFDNFDNFEAINKKLCMSLVCKYFMLKKK